MAKNLFLTSVAQILFANQGWKLSNQTILLASPMPVCTFVEEPLALSAKIVFSKSIFDVKNQSNFRKKKLSKNINLGDCFLVFFFLNLIFEPLYFLKLRPIFDELTFLAIIF